MDKGIISILITLFFCIIVFFHHYYIHRFDVEKSNVEKWFQWEDVNNHETVIIGLLGFVLGILICFLLK